MALALNIPIGANGEISIFLQQPGDIIVDVIGYYIPSTGAVVRAEEGDTTKHVGVSSTTVVLIVVAGCVLATVGLAAVLFFVLRANNKHSASLNEALLVDTQN